METKVAAGQSKQAPDRIPIDELCLVVPLLIYLAILGWATWEIRLVNPMALKLFLGLMTAVLVLAIADVWSRRVHNAFAVSLKRVPESVYLSTVLIGEPIKLSRPINNERLIIV